MQVGFKTVAPRHFQCWVYHSNYQMYSLQLCVCHWKIVHLKWILYFPTVAKLMTSAYVLHSLERDYLALDIYLSLLQMIPCSWRLLSISNVCIVFPHYNYSYRFAQKFLLFYGMFQTKNVIFAIPDLINVVWGYHCAEVCKKLLQGEGGSSTYDSGFLWCSNPIFNFHFHWTSHLSHY